jgi:hypothetical protein
MCEWWTLGKQSLTGHLKDKHRITRVEIIGVAERTMLIPRGPLAKLKKTSKTKQDS